MWAVSRPPTPLATRVFDLAGQRRFAELSGDHNPLHLNLVQSRREIFGDVVAVLAPPEDGEVAEAVSRLSGRRLLDGIRGGPAVDREALERIVGAVAELLRSDDEVLEIDCNPVMICEGNPMVADALVVLK